MLKSKVIKSNTQLIQIGQSLSINISTPIPEASIQFNKIRTTTANSAEILRIQGYNVDINGDINFPVLGRINLKGLKIIEAENHIRNLLLNKGLLKNHTVEIKILNSNFTVLGEVNNPGTFFYYENSITLFKALGFAGDLTINGKRDSVKLIRESEGYKFVHELDLTSASFLNSQFYYLESGDIIIIDPNTNRIKNAGIIGNSGTLLSLLSFILTSIILITNN